MGLTTAATLILELTLTRIFSVVFYYHFAFLAISVALFGLGAGGVLSYYVTARGPALFSRLALLYESVWYGEHEANVAVLNQMHDHQERLRHAVE